MFVSTETKMFSAILFYGNEKLTLLKVSLKEEIKYIMVHPHYGLPSGD